MTSKDRNQGVTYKRSEIDEFICSYRPFENMFFLAFTYKQSEIFEVIRNLCLLKSIFQLEITYKRQEISPLICNPPLLAAEPSQKLRITNME